MSVPRDLKKRFNSLQVIVIVNHDKLVGVLHPLNILETTGRNYYGKLLISLLSILQKFYQRVTMKILPYINLNGEALDF